MHQAAPDVVVTESRHFSRRGRYVPPLLAIEVLSESTQMYDPSIEAVVP